LNLDLVNFENYSKFDYQDIEAWKVKEQITVEVNQPKV
jgi:hypothetical protein